VNWNQWVNDRGFPPSPIFGGGDDDDDDHHHHHHEPLGSIPGVLKPLRKITAP
jgi:hypothetical protein